MTFFLEIAVLHLKFLGKVRLFNKGFVPAKFVVLQFAIASLICVPVDGMIGIKLDGLAPDTARDGRSPEGGGGTGLGGLLDPNNLSNIPDGRSPGGGGGTGPEEGDAPGRGLEGGGGTGLEVEGDAPGRGLEGGGGTGLEVETRGFLAFTA